MVLLGDGFGPVPEPAASAEASYHTSDDGNHEDSDATDGWLTHAQTPAAADESYNACNIWDDGSLGDSEALDGGIPSGAFGHFAGYEGIAEPVVQVIWSRF